MITINNKILSDVVYDKLKKMITDEQLQPGKKINKKELAELLGVSQTPINEAVSRLSGEKYIEQRARQGFFVKKFSNTELMDMYAVRAGLESLALRLAIEQNNQEELDKLTGFFRQFTSIPLSDEQKLLYIEEDKRFHQTVLNTGKNRVIREIDETFSYVIKSYQMGLIRDVEETMPEHQEIIRAIELRNAREAQELIFQHLIRTCYALKDMR